MKKTKYLLLLSAFMLVACGGADTSGTSSEPSTSSEPTSTYYDVVLPTNLANAYVTASKTKAVADEEVTITVAVTNSDFMLSSVTMNDKTLNGTQDEDNDNVYRFNFLMDEEDANISVDLIDTTYRDHTILFENNDFAFPVDLPTGANVGDVVNFKMSVVTGNELVSVEVLAGEDEEAVELTGDVFTGYSFEMPDADIKVVAHTQGAYFAVDVADELVMEGNDTIKTSDIIYGFMNSKNEPEDRLSTFVRAGEMIQLVGKHQYSYQGTHYYANGVEMVRDLENDYFVFTTMMPGQNVEIKAVAETREIAVNVNFNEEVISAFVYKADDETKTPISSAKTGDVLRIQATLKEGKSEDFAIKSVNATYDTFYNNRSQEVVNNSLVTGGTDWSDTSTSYYTTFKSIDENTKEFTVPGSVYWVDNTLNVVLKEKDFNLYNGEPFVGVWKAQEFYNYHSYGNMQSVEIDSAGDFISSTSYLKGISIDSIEGNTFALSDKRTLQLTANKKVGVMEYGTSYINKANDAYILAKTENNPEFKTYTNSSDEWFVTEVYEITDDQEKTLIGTVLGDNKADLDFKYYVDVEIEYVEGESLTDADAKFFVKKDDVRLKGVGIGIEEGTYEGEEETLVLDGFGKASLGGVENIEYVFDKAEQTVTFTLDGFNYVLSLDMTNGSYTVVSIEEVLGEDDPLPFYGLSFEGSCLLDEEWNDAGSAMVRNVTFNDTISFSEDGKLSLTQVSDNASLKSSDYNLEDISYNYESGARTVTFKVGIYNVSFQFNADFTTLTMTTNFPSIVAGRETVFTLVA